MKYFVIGSDKKYINVPQFIDWYKVINPEYIQQGTYHKIKDRTLIRVKFGKTYPFPEIIFFPFFMISKKIKKILEKYEPNMKYKEIILLDQVNARTELYFCPYLEKYECIDFDNTKFGSYNSEIDHLAVKRDLIDDAAVFYVEYNKKKYYVSRLDFLESLLRRGAILDMYEIFVERDE